MLAPFRRGGGAIRLFLVVLPAMLGPVFSVNAAKTVELVRDGRPVSVIVLPHDPGGRERYAAQELATHLKRMTGAELQLANGNVPEGMLPIYLGSAADPALDERTRAAGVNPSSFTLRVDDDRIDIRGLSEEGTLFGVYELLEQLGFRWYMPGEIGRVVPAGKTAALSGQVTPQAPSMALRLLQPWQREETGWFARVRQGGHRHTIGRHGIPGLGRDLFKEHPELFSMLPDENGRRRNRQHCLSNPEALRRATEAIRAEALKQDAEVQYVGASSFDGGNYCRCLDCQALDQGVYDPLGDSESMTDRYVWFFNKILESLEEELPNLHIVTYAYGHHMMPPAIEMNPRIIPTFAPINMDRIRSMDNPMSPDRYTLRWLINEYAERGVNEMIYRGYLNFLACVQLPKTQVDRVRNDYPVFHEKGIRAMRVQMVRQSWGVDPITPYLAARVMWDVETDVDALLDEFYRKFFGPAEVPMRQYFEKLEAAFRDTPYFTGSSYVYFPTFLDHPRRAELRNLLEEAAERVEADSKYAERIRILRMGYARMDLFLDMIQARNRHDFAAARALFEPYYEVTDKMVDYLLEDLGSGSHSGLRLLHLAERSDKRGNYFDRFFRRPLDEGYARTVTEGELVAPLGNVWDFLLDPAEIGEIGGWFRPGPLGGNWQPMRTVDRSWSDQGLHYYKGVAWYRQAVTIPEKFKGRPIYLWFGGVDEEAHVWVNGVFLGTKRQPLHGLPGESGTFNPFDLLATEAVRFGGENTVSVKVTNEKLNELGTGGIVAPVMFWSPRDPDWSP